MHSTMTWRSERVDDEEGEIRYEAHGPRDSFVVFEGPDAKADCDLFMWAINQANASRESSHKEEAV